jgi:hypothetical protein
MKRSGAIKRSGAVGAGDAALLRRFEPQVRYTRGERFFPMPVGPYVRECSLWAHHGRNGEAHCLVPEAELTLDGLGVPRAEEFDTVLFLKFIEPLNLADLASYEVERIREGLTQRDSRDIFRAGLGRLARVGYLSRFIDALFSISLLTRGRVPGDTAVAAALEYRRLREVLPQPVYYGRVVRQNDWLVLQYWFFYAFNNWRSGFFGLNDHEADWELISIYLDEEMGDVRPVWVAYAAHDFEGDDLRRHWDDPEVRKVGEHPVVYAGAGSHASYFLPGEYLTEVEISFLGPLARLLERLKVLWGRTRRELGEEDEFPRPNGLDIFSVPFVDYARGDGRVVGPGSEAPWGEPQLLNPVPDWALNYHGLWGLYARDPISGENAPAGPLYDRDGTLRRSWHDPVGWAGLDKVPPPSQTLRHVLRRREELMERRVTLTAEVARKSEVLEGLGVALQSMEGKPHLEAQYREHLERVAELSAEVNELREALGRDAALLKALEGYGGRVAAGDRRPVRAHLDRPHRPASEVELRVSRFAEVWAALSIGLTLVGVVLLALFSSEHLVLGLSLLLALFIFIEASFRRRLARLLNVFAISLALVGAGVLVFDFFWQVMVGAVLLAGGYLILENLRELWGA